MRYWLLLIGCLVAMYCPGQKQSKDSYQKEFSFLTENDAFMLKLKDGYYTNGIFLQLSLASENKGRKQVQRFELGQTMFTTGNRRAVLRGEENIDRPYCGYLYLKFAKDKVLPGDDIFSWNISLGVTGKLSLAQQLQDAYHNLINVYHYPYWEYQIPNAVGANVGLNYKRNLFNTGPFKMVANADANAGMFYTNAKIGTYFCLGVFENNANSALFNMRADKHPTASSKKNELFFYFYPQLIVQGYNATLQGTLFYKNNSGVITSEPSTLMYQQTFGLCYAKPRWNLRVETNWQTKETPLQNREQRYGGFQFAYRFD